MERIRERIKDVFILESGLVNLWFNFRVLYDDFLFRGSWRGY